jgi:Sulfotransferase family
VKSESLQNVSPWSSARDLLLGSGARKSWPAHAWRHSRQFVRESWYAVRPEERLTFASSQQIANSIAALHSQASDTTQEQKDTEAPIFLLSTGWRSGSTLLQRILVTDSRVFLWGEPLGEMTLVSRIAEMLSHLGARDLQFWHNQPGLESLSSAWLATSWIATFTPPSEDFRLALRALFDRWLAEPTRRNGFARWGFKEVRLAAAEARVLYWLYPNAKFVILSRHPYDCYLSLSGANYHPLYYRYPNCRVDSAAGFSRRWNQLALSWAELPEGFPFFHVKYEDLVSGQFDFRKLESWLGIQITEDIALSVVVGHSSARPQLSWYERRIIAREAGGGMRALGYSI